MTESLTPKQLEDLITAGTVQGVYFGGKLMNYKLALEIVDKKLLDYAADIGANILMHGDKIRNDLYDFYSRTVEKAFKNKKLAQTLKALSRERWESITEILQESYSNEGKKSVELIIKSLDRIIDNCLTSDSKMEELLDVPAYLVANTPRGKHDGIFLAFLAKESKRLNVEEIGTLTYKHILKDTYMLLNTKKDIPTLKKALYPET